MPSECAMCAVSVLVTDGHDWEEGDLCYTCLASEHACLKQRTAALQSQLKEAKEGWDSAIADLYAAAEIAKGMQSQLDAKWISVDVKLPPVMRAVLTTDGKRVTQTYRTSHDKRMWGAWAPDQVTFWQPLPPPPSGAKEQK